ncbi:MAG: hypothetical protein Q7S37_00670 [bacterium]|nr:hypothetical protein [bacterium]
MPEEIFPRFEQSEEHETEEDTEAGRSTGWPELHENETNTEAGESEGITTVVEIDLTRHGKKESQVRGPEDYKVHLNTLGKTQALDKAIKMGEMTEVMAKGSPRVRARETAGITALSQEIMQELGASTEEIDALLTKLLAKEELNEAEKTLAGKIDGLSLEGLEEKFTIRYDFEGIDWIESDDRLDFQADAGPVAKKENEVFAAGNLMPWFVNESDQMALDEHDKDAMSYSMLAANVADILLGYTETSSELNRFVKSNPEQYSSISKDGSYNFRRIFGTHASVGESFMLKVVGMTKGAEARDELCEKVKAGFKEAEGFKFTITDDGKEKIIKMTLPERLAFEDGSEIIVTEDILKDIIKQSEDLKAEINKE